ncbi:MAG: DNA repair protein RecN [Actinomycetota bacterium]|nr:MAG: DNA repair protein RecN [Actinomycetota bacterium]
MLRELHIRGLGVIERLELELRPGLNVLTGETGAGKTMITVGLHLALGRRATASLVRKGAPAAEVELRADAPPVALREGWAEDGEVICARRVGADGRSTARIGGRLAPLSALAAIGEELVELHGQHEGLRLLSPAAQIAFLDRFAGADHLETLREHVEAYARVRELEGRLEELERGERDRERELDLLAYQIREIELAAPRPGERAELEAEAARLAHVERLLELTGIAAGALGEEGSGGDALAAAAGALRRAAELDPAAAPLADRAAALADEVVELLRETRRYADGLAADPARLEEVQARLSVLGGLRRKYGEDEAEILAFLERARARAAELATAGARAEGIRAELEGARASLRDLTDRLSEGRRRAAPALAEAIEGELRELGMAGARVEVRLIPHPAATATGAERVELAFAGGPRQPLLPLAKVASGGELARTMLACRSAVADLDDVPTLVFDEVDQGIGGEAALAVGRRLARLAERRQVLVVTHLPQIAAFADHHVLVDKRAGTAAVRVLTGRERVVELARMLAGMPGSRGAIAHAEELLEEVARLRARGRRPAPTRGRRRG